MEQQTGSKLRREYVKAVYSPCLFNLYAEYIMRNTGLDEAWAGIKILGKNNSLKICRWYYSSGKQWRGTKEPLEQDERGEWKGWLKMQYSKREDHGVQCYHFMANRWEKMETVTDFIFLGSKTTADGDCSHEIKRPWNKSGDKSRQCIKKQRRQFAKRVGP